MNTSSINSNIVTTISPTEDENDLLLAALDVAIDIAQLGVNLDADIFLDCYHALDWARNVYQKETTGRFCPTLSAADYIHRAIFALKRAKVGPGIAIGHDDLLSDISQQLMELSHELRSVDPA